MFRQEKIKDINKRFETLNHASAIVIWGAGVHTSKLFENTNLLAYNIMDIVDMDIKKHNSQYYGFTIKAPDQINWEQVENVVISVPGKEREIAELLSEDMRFEKNIITLYEDNKHTPFYHFYDKNIPGIWYLGDYCDWDSASDECKGYDDGIILDKVISSTQRVLKGDAIWERDGYLFYEQKYVYRICAAILRCALQNNGLGVRVLDIGGALGSTYFQNRKYLADVKNLEYIVAEQTGFANYGHRNLENGELRFINSLDDYLKYSPIDIILMSASLHYIKQSEDIIKKVLEVKPRYIILDRMLIGRRSRICVEKVPEEIYKSSYPVKIYTENEIIGLFAPEYDIVEKDISSVPEYAFFEDDMVESKYYVFKRNI